MCDWSWHEAHKASRACWIQEAVCERAPRSKPPLPQTFTPSGAVLHTRLFTHSEACVQARPLSPSLTHTQTFTLSQAPHILAHTSLSIHSLDQGNPRTYRQRRVLRANPIPSKCGHLWSWHVAQTPQRWYNKALSSFMFAPFLLYSLLSYKLKTTGHMSFNKNVLSLQWVIIKHFALAGYMTFYCGNNTHDLYNYNNIFRRTI